MYQYPWGGPPLDGQVAKVDPLTVPLPTEHPADWNGRVERVRWCLANLSPGEKSMLYRLLHQAEGVRLDRCKFVESQEKKSLTPKTKKEVWP